MKNIRTVLINITFLIATNIVCFVLSSYLEHGIVENAYKDRGISMMLPTVISFITILYAYICFVKVIKKKGHHSYILLFNHITMIFWTMLSLAFCDYSAEFKCSFAAIKVITVFIFIFPLSILILAGSAVGKGLIKKKQ